MGQPNTKYSDDDKDCVTQTVVELPELFHDGEMREVEIEGSKLLIAKENGKFFALSANCPCDDNGESLVTGVLYGGRVRCAQHGAVFDVATGDLLEHPGLDSLHSYRLDHVEGVGVQVRANKEKLKEDGRIKTSARLFPTEKIKTILIIGAGAAGLVCAETLRQEGFVGKIVVVTSEKYLPYDRTKLSKVSVLADGDGSFSLRDRKFYSNREILFKTDKEAIRIKKGSNKVIFKDGDEITYHKLLIATGCRARKLLSVPGHDLVNITTLRSLADLSAILVSSASEHVVIVGASFLGIELAESLVGKAKSVTVVDKAEAPLQKTLGKEVGEWIKRALMSRGVIFYMNTSVKEFQGEIGRLNRVALADGTMLEASLCVTAIGVEPVTDFLKDSGLVIAEKQFLVVDKQMKTNKEHVFGAGDVTEFPLFLVNDDRVNIPHWQMAQQQGRVAALNMLDKTMDIHSVPYFCLTVGGHALRFTGHSVGHEAAIVKGRIDQVSPSFVAYYIKDDKVIGAASVDRDPITSQLAELLVARQSLDVADILPDTAEWISRLKLALVDGPAASNHLPHSSKETEASTHL